ncbi:hypothetical protein BH10BAC5_BH10BAC5_05400 [soil metagenome]
MEQTTTSQEDVKKKALKILKDNHSVFIATTGGEFSPWILGAYYAEKDLDLYLFLETSGKSMKNVLKNNTVAISISKNEASEDFLQASAEIDFLGEEEEKNVRKMLTDKMPWYQTYTPVAPVRLNLKKIFVTSITDGWFPAKTLDQ